MVLAGELDNLAPATPAQRREVRKADALMSLYFHIPFPERLSDDIWMEKFRQIQWLADKGLLGAKSPNNE